MTLNGRNGTLAEMNYFYGLDKNISFRQEWRFGRSRSSKVIDLGTNQKCVCDVLLVRNTNLGPILHRFGDIPAFMCSWPHPYSTLILGCCRCTRSPMLGYIVWGGILGYLAVKLLYEVFQPMWSRYLNVSGRQTDGQTISVRTEHYISETWWVTFKEK